MESSEMVRHIRELSEMMAVDAARSLSAQVEHCPAWKVADLVRHLGDVQWFWSQIIERRVQDRREMTDVTRPTDAEKADALAYFRTNTARMCAALDTVADDDALWTWWEPLQNARFIKRRQVLEVAVHGWDARNAVGDPRPLPANIARLGIHEFVDVMTGDLREDRPTPPPVELAVTDDSLVTDTTFTTVMFAHHDGVPVSLAGTSSDVLLTLWGRRQAADPAVASALAALDLS